MTNSKLSSCAIVLVTPDIEHTAGYYREVLGFRVVEHYAQPEKFAALYRDAVEIVLVEAQFGTMRSNRAQYGAGFDAYLVPESPAAVDDFCAELKARGAKIVQLPINTAYGSREFVLEDIDGRLIGVGCIQDVATFFGKAAPFD